MLHQPRRTMHREGTMQAAFVLGEREGVGEGGIEGRGSMRSDEEGPGLPVRPTVGREFCSLLGG